MRETRRLSYKKSNASPFRWGISLSKQAHCRSPNRDWQNKHFMIYWKQQSKFILRRTFMKISPVLIAMFATLASIITVTIMMLMRFMGWSGAKIWKKTWPFSGSFASLPLWARCFGRYRRFCSSPRRCSSHFWRSISFRSSPISSAGSLMPRKTKNKTDLASDQGAFYP